MFNKISIKSFYIFNYIFKLLKYHFSLMHVGILWKVKLSAYRSENELKQIYPLIGCLRSRWLLKFIYKTKRASGEIISFTYVSVTKKRWARRSIGFQRIMITTAKKYKSWFRPCEIQECLCIDKSAICYAYRSSSVIDLI